MINIVAGKSLGLDRHEVETCRWWWGCALVLLALGGLLGCQGVSGAASNQNAGGGLTVASAHLDFGTVVVGASKPLMDTVTNLTSSSVTISQATVTGSGFQVVGPGFPLTLPAGQSVSLSLTFTPLAAGSPGGSVVLTSDAPNPNTIVALSGTAVSAGQLVANPASVSFGTVQVGSSQTKAETFTNSGGSSLTITQVTLSGTEFQISGLNLPLILNPQQSASFSVTFAPNVTGAASGSIAVMIDVSLTANQARLRKANANSNPQTVTIPVSGTGAPAGPLTASPASLSFGSVQLGSSQSQPETLSNSGASSITVSQATATGAGFSFTGLSLPVTLAAGQTATFNVTFAPQAAGTANGNLAIISNGSNPMLSIPLSGTGVTAGAVTANPSSLNFGSVQVNNTATLSDTLTNSGGSSVTISQVTVTGSGFSKSGINLPLTLTPGQSFTFTAAFTPTAAGVASGSMAIVSNGSNPNLSVPLSGTGTAAGQLAVTPTTQSFGNVTVGTSASLPGTLSATGASVTVSSAGVNSPEFSVSGLSFPFTVAAGQSKAFTVTFTPQASGAASASATFVSNAGNSPATEALSGTGTPPPQHSVDLSWNENGTGVVGYNVYRGTKSGGPYTRINTALDATTAYTDAVVTAGQTYYYVTTAVDGSNNESTYSNEFQALIPTP